MQRPAYSPENEREYMARGWWRDDDTLWRWLSARAASENPAIVWSAGTLTWRMLHERVLRVAEGFPGAVWKVGRRRRPAHADHDG